ncbi:hypothetical protein C8R48DRAFT_103417 [Suillus tomentosus]|nr:hypothetical protein C8R48DRAFT_103417 [Suillus tomentosus]
MMQVGVLHHGTSCFRDVGFYVLLNFEVYFIRFELHLCEFCQVVPPPFCMSFANHRAQPVWHNQLAKLGCFANNTTSGSTDVRNPPAESAFVHVSRICGNGPVSDSFSF